MQNFIPSYLLTLNQVKTPVADEGALLVQFLDWGIRHAKTSAQRECAWHIVAAIINKHSTGDEQLFSVTPLPCLPTGKGLDTFLKTTLTTFWDNEIAKPLDPDARRRAISAWAWVRILSIIFDGGHVISHRFLGRS